MLFSYQWLKTYVPEIPEPQVLKEELTRRSVEVEAIESAYPLLRDIIVAEITQVEKHPNADRLSVCTVNTGREEIQVVCGGSNVKAGMRVALAPVGATVQWHGEGEPIVLEKATLRGVDSFGMICSTNEIGLAALFPPHEREVFDLSGVHCQPGQPIAEALGLHDFIIDIDNKSMTHRPDLFSHRGLAREIAAVFNLPVTLPEVADTCVNAPVLEHVVVEEPELCRRFRLIELSVRVGVSPEIIRNRLHMCGIKPINTVVDITNYVLLEYGQPVHAFDADHVYGGVTVRRARAGEKIETLDHETHAVSPDMLVIADEQRALHIAGVIGGMSSAVREHTVRIFLEVAHFDAVSIRKTSQGVGVRTDGVLRWEKGPSEDLPTYSAPAAVQLLQQYADAQVIRAIDVYPKKRTQQSVRVEQSAIDRLVGIAIPLDESRDMLTRLGCEVVTEGQALIVTPPWFRMDLKIQEDVIEEIVRMYGIHRIPEQQLTGRLDVPEIESEFAVIRAIRERLVNMQFCETYSYSFYGEDRMRAFGIDSEPHVEIMNPLSDDLRFLRVSVLPNMLMTMTRNVMHQSSLECFEIGHVYFADREVRQLCMLVSGPNAFRRLRGAVEQLHASLHIPYTTQVITQTAECAFWQWYEGGQALEYRTNGAPIGTMGQLSSTVAAAVKMKEDCAFAVLSIPQLVHDESITQAIRIPSSYPSIPLDLSLIVPEHVQWGGIEHIIREQGGNILHALELVDVYTGAPLETGTKSFLCHLEFQAKDHTLEMSEIERWRESCVAKCAERYGAVLRDNS